jgi:hypothetical protein
MWATRLRWRLRGASQWPAFVLFTALEGILLNALPVSGRGPGGFVAGVLLAGFGNLFLLAVLAPLAGARIRRRRPDLPKPVATDYAGTALVAAGALALLAVGVAHRPVVAEERADRAAQYGAVAGYVASQAPGYRAGLVHADSIRLSEDLYRTCVPGADPRRPLCLFVETDQHPPGITRDPDLTPNAAYR